MGVYIVSGNRDTGDITPEKIFNLYRKAGFIYPEKEKRMAPFLDCAIGDWSELLSTSPEYYQIHFSRDETNAICASLSGFRDSPNLFVIQHAISFDRPDQLLECLLSETTGVSRIGVNNLCMYFTSGNKWPERLTKAFDATHPSGATDRVFFDYYYAICDSGSPLPSRESAIDLDKITTLLTKSQGKHRTLALGLDQFSQSESQSSTTSSHFSFPVGKKGHIKRNLYIIPYYQRSNLVGVGLVFTSLHIMNLSHLCSRIEVHIDPDAEDKTTIAQQIVLLGFNYIASEGFQVATVLIPSRLGLSSYKLPRFGFPVKQYCCYLWKADGDAGFASSSIALSKMYAQIQAYKMLREKRSKKSEL